MMNVETESLEIESDLSRKEEVASQRALFLRDCAFGGAVIEWFSYLHAIRLIDYSSNAKRLPRMQ